MSRAQLAFDFAAAPPPMAHPRKRPAYKSTSREALRTFAPVSGSLNAMILRAIGDAGPAGIICQAVEEKIGRSHEAVSGNLRHLVEDERVRWTGNYGRTKANRKAMLWVLVTQGTHQ